MAPTEGRFAMPERRWHCRRGTVPPDRVKLSFVIFDIQAHRRPHWVHTTQ